VVTRPPFRALWVLAGSTEGLQAALLRHAREREVEETLFGTQYVVEGPIRTPDGRSPQVRTVRLERTEGAGPGLGTAYLSKRR